jgi:hypothetical protein
MTQHGYYYDESGSSSTPLIVVMVILFLIILVGGGLAFWYFLVKKKEGEKCGETVCKLTEKCTVGDICKEKCGDVVCQKGEACYQLGDAKICRMMLSEYSYTRNQNAVDICKEGVKQCGRTWRTQYVCTDTNLNVVDEQNCIDLNQKKPYDKIHFCPPCSVIEVKVGTAWYEVKLEQIYFDKTYPASVLTWQSASSIRSQENAQLVTESFKPVSLITLTTSTPYYPENVIISSLSSSFLKSVPFKLKIDTSRSDHFSLQYANTNEWVQMQSNGNITPTADENNRSVFRLQS